MCYLRWLPRQARLALAGLSSIRATAPQVSFWVPPRRTRGCRGPGRRAHARCSCWRLWLVRILGVHGAKSVPGPWRSAWTFRSSSARNPAGGAWPVGSQRGGGGCHRSQPPARATSGSTSPARRSAVTVMVCRWSSQLPSPRVVCWASATPAAVTKWTRSGSWTRNQSCRSNQRNTCSGQQVRVLRDAQGSAFPVLRSVINADRSRGTDGPPRSLDVGRLRAGAQEARQVGRYPPVAVGRHPHPGPSPADVSASRNRSTPDKPSSGTNTTTPAPRRALSAPWPAAPRKGTFRSLSDLGRPLQTALAPGVAYPSLLQRARRRVSSSRRRPSRNGATS
jgi:hypothetical protein